MKRPLYIERALFVVGDQNSGKSTQLRSMFTDLRFGTNGVIPETKRIKGTVVLSTDRALHLRLTSPHEYEDTPETFLREIERKTVEGRWCFACALQPEAFKGMLGLKQTVRSFIKHFSPDRVRICLLSPNRHGRTDSRAEDFSKQFWDEDGVEFVCIDARHRTTNGSFLADFFDFT